VHKEPRSYCAVGGIGDSRDDDGRGTTPILSGGSKDDGVPSATTNQGWKAAENAMRSNKMLSD
jgi:hypothetical protein